MATAAPEPGHIAADTLRLLADDLTGALDAAAAFAAPGRALTLAILHRDGLTWPDGAAIASSGTRDGTAASAAARVAALAASLARGRPAVKKIDSLLRGNTVAEIAACAGTGLFRRIVVAPAFPAQGRVLAEGRLRMRLPDGTWRTETDLSAALHASGVPHARTGPGVALPASGVVLCDAATEADLAALAAQGAPGTLWAVSAGLARLLAPPARPVALPAARPALVVAGSPHAVLQAQIRRAAAQAPSAFVPACDPADPHGPAASVAERLAAGRPALLCFAPPPMEAGAACAALAALLARVAAGPAPGLVLASGGETLAMLCAALACQRLEVRGEVAPGLPLGLFVGGAWDGVALVGKSGAFDDHGVLARLLG